MPYLNIKTRIILYHFFLVLLLVAGLGYHQYNQQLNTHINSVRQFHQSASSSIVNKSSKAISGANYANIQMPSFIDELKRNKKLNFMRIAGISDNSKVDFCVLYDQSTGQMWRDKYPQNYVSDIHAKLNRLQTSLRKSNNIDRVKVNFLIERNKEKIQRYQKNLRLSKKHAELIESLTIQKASFVQLETKKLFISIPTNNKNGGDVQIIFNITEIEKIKSQLLESILFESIFALTLSLIILTILSNKITSPINNLSAYISQKYGEHKLTDIPCLNRKDEIGYLANTVYSLLEKTKNYERKLEKLSKKDPLTGLGNRRELDSVFSKIHLSKKLFIAVLYIDIDNFKKYNDSYGHNMGDLALQKVAQSIEDSLQRKADYAFRLGGEEFAVLVSVFDFKQLNDLAERIRKNVQNLAIEHKSNNPNNVVTISIGAYLRGLKPEAKTSEDLIDMLNYADQNLLQAKKEGRNRIVTSYKDS